MEAISSRVCVRELRLFSVCFRMRVFHIFVKKATVWTLSACWSSQKAVAVRPNELTLRMLAPVVMFLSDPGNLALISSEGTACPPAVRLRRRKRRCNG